MDLLNLKLYLGCPVRVRSNDFIVLIWCVGWISPTPKRVSIHQEFLIVLFSLFLISSHMALLWKNFLQYIFLKYKSIQLLKMSLLSLYLLAIFFVLKEFKIDMLKNVISLLYGFHYNCWQQVINHVIMALSMILL